MWKLASFSHIKVELTWSLNWFNIEFCGFFFVGQFETGCGKNEAFCQEFEKRTNKYSCWSFYMRGMPLKNFSTCINILVEVVRTAGMVVSCYMIHLFLFRSRLIWSRKKHLKMVWGDTLKNKAENTKIVQYSTILL